MIRTIDDVMADMDAITNASEGRAMTDEEITNYQNLEAELNQLNKSDQIRARQKAYNTPVREHTGVATKVDDTHERAFLAYLRSGQPNTDLIEVSNSQGVGVGSEGGYLVPTTFRQKIVEKVLSFGGLASVVDSFNTSSGGPVTWVTMDDTANEGAITPENEQFQGGADLVFGEAQLGAYKYTSTGAGNDPLRVSVELLQDSAFNVEALVTKAMGIRIARKQAKDWVLGTGVMQPKGILSTTADETLTTLNTLTYADLLAVEEGLDEAYEANARWVMNKTTWIAMKALEDGNDRPLILPQAQSGIAGRPPKELLGYPVTIDPAFPSYNSAASAKFAILGDTVEAYVIRRVSNMAVVVNPYTRANYGQVEFTAWERADGTIQNRNAYRVLANHA
jgi:HK97 family phage major capsid protein